LKKEYLINFITFPAAEAAVPPLATKWSLREGRDEEKLLPQQSLSSRAGQGNDARSPGECFFGRERRINTSIYQIDYLLQKIFRQ